MNTALATRDDVTYDGEIIETHSQAPMTLFGTDDPKAVVERASAVATALASVIDQRRLYASIGGKKHVQVEGWTLLGSMTGVFAETVWSRPVEDGWEARAVARTMAGAIVGAAEAMCTRREGRWRSADDYAVRSMAQTRAVSKALRMPLGFIMHLAGYDATPAEEIPTEQPGRPAGVGVGRSAAPAPKNKGEALGRLAEVGREHGLSFAQIEQRAKRLGISRQSGTVDDIMRLIADIEQPGDASAHATPAPDTSAASVADQDAPASDAGAGEARASAPATDTPSQVDEPADAVPATATSEAGDSSPVASPPAAQPTIEDVLAITGGEEVEPDGSNITIRMSPPPRPGTPEYRALPTGTERAKARAYWEAQQP